MKTYVTILIPTIITASAPTLTHMFTFGNLGQSVMAGRAGGVEGLEGVTHVLHAVVVRTSTTRPREDGYVEGDKNLSTCTKNIRLLSEFTLLCTVDT